MSVHKLLDPILDQGLLHTNFFEGRLLSAQDLRDQQDANRERGRRLARALGSGIVDGLEVVLESDGADGQPPVVTVKSGLAINAEGEIIGLPRHDVQVALARSIAATPTTEADFYACAGPPTTRHLPNGVGVYVLVMSPAAGYKDRAPLSGLGDAGVVRGCGSRYVQEGVKFRLVDATPAVLAETDPSLQTLLRDDLLSATTPAPKGDAKRLSLLRNVLAYQWLRSEFDGPNGLAAALRRAGRDAVTDDTTTSDAALQACEVPLALLYWTLDGVAFHDLWAVRRMVAAQTSGADVARSLTRGVERVLQFAEHVDWLLATFGAPSAAHVSEYFRFLPPGGFLPVRAPGFTDGFRVDEFLEDLYAGGPMPATLGQSTRLLLDSFVYEYVNLTGSGMLQLYGLTRASGEAADVESGRRYQLYVARELYGPLASDHVAKVLEDAWDVYRGLIRRQVFLPPASDDAAVAARQTITEAIRDIMAVANRYAALALGADLDLAGGLRAYQVMHAIQNDMVELFAGDIPGIDDTQERELFASAIEQYLNHELPGARPGLRTALAAGSLIGAVDAQAEINRFVGAWSGEGVAVGPFGFTYSNSPEGVGLVPGADPIPQVFTLSNGTNRTLTMMLRAEAGAETGDWSTSTQILGAIGGGEIDRATLASGASREIVVVVGAPEDSAVDEPVTLTLSAEVGPPTSRTSTYTNATLLSVAESSGGPVAGQVTIAQHRFNPLSLDPANIAPGLIFRLMASVTYSAGDGIARDFDLDLMVEAGDEALWTFRDEDTGALLPAAPSGTGFTLRMSAVPADGAPAVGRVRIQAPARDPTVDRSVTLGLSIRSVDLDPAISHEYPQSITLVVQHGT